MSCDIWKLKRDGVRGSAGVHAGVALRTLRGIAQWRLRDQAARIDGPEGDAGLDGCVDRGVQLRLVVDAVQPQSAGEVDERLLLIQLAEHMRRGLQARRAGGRC